MFDEEKLAWVNRHYLKIADPLRLAELSLPYFDDAGVAMTPDRTGLEFLASVMPMASASVDRLDQVPARLAFLFDYDAEAALGDARVRDEMRRRRRAGRRHARWRTSSRRRRGSIASAFARSRTG